jgi:hypothetical protein
MFKLVNLSNCQIVIKRVFLHDLLVFLHIFDTIFYKIIYNILYIFYSAILSHSAARG